METIKEAAIRKAKEETNLDCEFIKTMSVEESIFPKNQNMKTDLHTVNICCHLIPKSIEYFQLDKYQSDFKWVNKQNAAYHKAVNYPLSLMGFNNI